MMKNKYFDEKSLPVRVVRIDSQSAMGLHYHDFHELVIVFDGEGIHFTEKNKYKISAGDVFLVKPGKSHGYEDTAGLELVNLLYLPARLNLPLYDLVDVPGFYAFFELEPAMRRQHGFKARLQLGGDKIIYLKRLVKYIEEELDSGRSGALFSTASYMMQLMVYIARNYTESELPAQMDIIKLGNVLSYIETSYQHNITLAGLAQRAAMSETTLYRMFHKAFSMSPINYVISIRLAKARKMLDHSGKSISEIAWKCGFSDSNYFSRIFKKIRGISPRQYRQK